MRLFRLFFVWIVLLNVNFAGGQNLFQQRIGDFNDEILPWVIDADDGFIVFGRTASGSFGNDDLTFFKINTNGNIVWQNHIGNSKRNLNKQMIHYKSNYFAIGWINLYDLVDDICFMVINENGELLKKKTYGASFDDEILSVAYMEQDKFVFVGESLSFRYSEGPDMFISVVDGDLNIEPLTIYYGNNGVIPRKVVYTKDSCFFIAGTYRYDGIKGFVMKTDRQGNYLWGHCFGQEETKLWNAIEMEDGSLVCVGQTTGFSASLKDILFLRFGTDGTLLDSKILGGTGIDVACNLVRASDGNIVVVGNTSSFGNGSTNVFFLKLDKNGNFIDGYIYGGDGEDAWPSITKTADNSGYLLGFESTSFGADNYDFLLIRTDNDGVSCCQDKIEEITVKDIDVVLQNPGFGKAIETFTETNRQLQKEPVDYDNDSLCLSSVEIIGPDTLYCLDTATYSVLPFKPANLVWEIPEGATLLNNQNNISVTIDFGGVSGMIYLISGNCPSDTLDSLYVVVKSGSISGFDLGPDTTFCSGNSVIISPGGGYENYLWQDGSTDTLMIAGQAGVYWVKVTDTSGCSAVDSLTVSTFPAFNFTIGNDTAICYGDYVFLSGPDGYEKYLWQDGSVYTTYIATDEGIYWLQISDSNNCIATDSMQLITNKVPENILGNDTLFCKGGSFTLTTYPAYDQYFWQDGTTDSVFVVQDTGKYWVTVFDTLGCSGTDSINLAYFPVVTLELQSSGYLCDDDSVVLMAVSNYNNYLWQDGSLSQTCIARDSGTYWVKTGSPCETKSDTIVIDACSSIWIPNVFTSNNDGFNDYFYAIGKNIPKFKMEIINRWGQTLKVLHSIEEKWDGTYRGQKAAEGTYFWEADYEQVNRNGSTEHIRLQGSVTLVR